MKKFTTLFITLLSVLVVTACGNTSSNSEAVEPEKGGDDAVTITHSLGEVTIPKNPENVVVYDFGILDSLDKLGADISGVPQAGIVPSYLSKYAEADYANVGSLKEPDFEKVSELAPELIIISTRQAEAYKEFSKIAPTLYVETDYTNYWESFSSNMKLLGQILEKDVEVEAELTAIRKSVDALSEKTSTLEETGLIVLVNDGSVSAYGSNSRYGIIHDMFGIAPADENIEVSTHGQNVSFEYIAEKNPDILFVIDRGAAVGGESSAATVLDNELINKTSAAQNGKIVYLDPEFWYLSGGGLVSVSEMIKQINEIIK